MSDTFPPPSKASSVSPVILECPHLLPQLGDGHVCLPAIRVPLVLDAVQLLLQIVDDAKGCVVHPAVLHDPLLKEVDVLLHVAPLLGLFSDLLVIHWRSGCTLGGRIRLFVGASGGRACGRGPFPASAGRRGDVGSLRRDLRGGLGLDASRQHARTEYTYKADG